MARIFKEGGELVFDPSYLPDSLPHREQQMAILRDSIEGAILKAAHTTPILYGPSGTGKTSVLRAILREVEGRYKKVMCTLINATIHSKTYVAIQRISSKVIPVPERGFSAEELLLKLYDRLDMEDVQYVVGIDDADELIRRERGKLLEVLTRVEENYGQRLIHPIVVLRNLEILNGLPPHITSKLGGLAIEFPRYNKRQLKDILAERIEKGINEGRITGNAVECASFATDLIYKGNARELINLTLRAGKIAEYLNDEEIKAEHVRQALFESYTRLQRSEIREGANRVYYRVLWSIAKHIAEEPDIYYVDEGLMLRSYETFVKSFGERIPFESYDKTVKEMVTISNRDRSYVLAVDEGRLVYLSYPARVLVKELSSRIF